MTVTSFEKDVYIFVRTLSINGPLVNLNKIFTHSAFSTLFAKNRQPGLVRLNQYRELTLKLRGTVLDNNHLWAHHEQPFSHYIWSFDPMLMLTILTAVRVPVSHPMHDGNITIQL